MRIPDNVHENTSGEMTAVIAAVLDDEMEQQPATLASVREAILAEIKTVTIPLNRFSSDQRQELQDEIDNLIEDFGEDALAVRFMRPWASEALCRLIEAGLDDLGEPSLAALFDAAEGGLLAHLVAQGELDAEDVQTVIAELQKLIDQHGPEALAENFLGPE